MINETDPAYSNYLIKKCFKTSYSKNLAVKNFGKINKYCRKLVEKLW